MGAAGSVLDERDDESYPSWPVREESPTKKSAKPDPTGRPTFTVSLGFWPGKKVDLPDTFKLRIGYESLDFLKADEPKPLIQFPFQNIICWGSSRQNFQFKVYDFESSDSPRKENGILISLKTNQGRMIEDTTMSTVKSLMEDMQKRAISKQEFQTLLSELFIDEEQLKEDWLSTIDQFSAGDRKFLAKQGMELLIKVGALVPFEKFDLACLLYDRIINKNSFQLLVNTFPDERERSNLIHRLKLSDEFVVHDCALLPEKSEIQQRKTQLQTTAGT